MVAVVMRNGREGALLGRAHRAASPSHWDAPRWDGGRQNRSVVYRSLPTRLSSPRLDILRVLVRVVLMVEISALIVLAAHAGLF